MEYSVNLFGSHPDEDNDDCYIGEDFATLAEARECIANLAEHFNPVYYHDVPFIVLDGPDVHEVICTGKKPAKDDDSEWKRERAMQAGMAFGCDGYNDEMGY